MTKREIAEMNGYDLGDAEIDLLCYVWTNVPKGHTSVAGHYVDLSQPTDDWPNPGRKILTAMQLEGKGLLECHTTDNKRYSLTNVGEKLVEAFYQIM